MIRYFCKSISKPTIFIALFIIISASFMRQIMDFTKAHIGQRGFTILMTFILVMPVLAFLIFIIRKSQNWRKTTAIIMLLIIGLFLAWQLEIPQERIHILEYGVLGWLTATDLVKFNRKKRGIVFACIFCLIIGILDEIFQWLLPYRIFEIRDIVLNCLGGIWGIILYLLGR